MSTVVSTRKWLAIGAVAVLIPVVVGALAYLFLHQGIVSKYDACVSTLNNIDGRSPGLELVIESLSKVPRFKDAKWNLNAPYDPSAINILVPSSADEAWHAKCGLPVAPADCLAAASEQFLICNAIVGRQLANPLLRRGIGREEIRRARLFLALAFIGHELGHLKSGSRATVQHLFPTNRASGLKCTRPDNDGPSEERQADEFGVRIACEAVRLDGTEPIATDARSAIKTLSYLRDSMDEEYFAFDDTCGGDDSYPSMSRRKSMFSRDYARCLYPEDDLPYAAVAGDQDLGFKHLEEWLRQRQRDAIVGSAMYGRSAVYRYDVAGTKSSDMFVAFDSSPTASQISATASTEERVEHTVLAAWDQFGDLIDAHSIKSSEFEFLASFAAPNDATDVRLIHVSCSPTPAACKAEQTTRRLPPGVRLVGSTTHAIIEISGRRLRAFASASDYFNGQSTFETRTDTDPAEETTVLDANTSRIVVGIVPRERITSGFHRVGVASAGELRWTVFTTLPTTAGQLSAVALYEQQVAFVFQPYVMQLGGSTQLWVCPAARFEGAASVTTGACDVYSPPEDISFSVASANNDLTSLSTHFLPANYCDGLIVVRLRGWLWLVDPQSKRQDLVPGTGLISCSKDRTTALVYRLRRIDDVRLEFRDATPTQETVGLAE